MGITWRRCGQTQLAGEAPLLLHPDQVHQCAVLTFNESVVANVLFCVCGVVTVTQNLSHSVTLSVTCASSVQRACRAAGPSHGRTASRPRGDCTCATDRGCHTEPTTSASRAPVQPPLLVWHTQAHRPTSVHTAAHVVPATPGSPRLPASASSTFTQLRFHSTPVETWSQVACLPGGQNDGRRPGDRPNRSSKLKALKPNGIHPCLLLIVVAYDSSHAYYSSTPITHQRLD